MIERETPVRYFSLESVLTWGASGAFAHRRRLYTIGQGNWLAIIHAAVLCSSLSSHPAPYPPSVLCSNPSLQSPRLS